MSDPEKSVSVKFVPWYLESRFVLWMVFIFGPLALPLVWLTPRFSTTWKIVTTILSVAISIFIFKTSAQMLQFLTRHLKDIQDASVVG